MQKKPTIKRFYRLLCFLGTTPSIIFIDQFFKYKISHNGGFYLCNSGVSFGVPVPGVIFWLVCAIFFLILTFFLHKKPPDSYLLVVGLTFLCGGVLSNLLDRVRFGCVLDYITLFKEVFPVFNIADVGIFLGSCLILFRSLIKRSSWCV